MYKFPPKNTKKTVFRRCENRFWFCQNGRFTGFPVLAKTVFHSLVATRDKILQNSMQVLTGIAFLRFSVQGITIMQRMQITCQSKHRDLNLFFGYIFYF